ncbi:MAG: hypothetical protein OXC31_14970 [Spirochaetaceae bacterium]|nr:hypothetical protein [Spirochaetaceae bacterium]
MPKQLELLAGSGLEVQPEADRSEPRLWIRRLVIWSEPGVILREVNLRPGLNIIWAPDPADRPGESEQHAAPGHGSGKTLFCRLLRYCLGEDRFAAYDQREKIVAAFPNGLVGAEIMVAGTQWAVVRPIGATRKHFAIRDSTVDAVSTNAVPTGMDPFLEALATRILSKDIAGLVPSDSHSNAWLVTLAWLTRDQECRFDKPLDWRSADSESGSPARKLSAQQHLAALRALLGALSAEETKIRKEIGEVETQREQHERDAIQRAREAERLRAHLIGILGQSRDDFPPGRMAVEPLRNVAVHQLAQVSHLDSGDHLVDVGTLRSEAEQTRLRVEDLKRRLATVEARIPEIEKLASRIKGELPVASARVATAEIPVCEICEVPIDRALANGCRLSHKLPDLDAAKRRMEHIEQDFADASTRLENAHDERRRLIDALDPAQKDHASVAGTLQTAERIRDARADAWYRSRRLIDDVDRLDELFSEQEHVQSRLADLENSVQEKREQAGVVRNAHASTFSRLSRFFDAIVSELIGPDTAGRVTLDGNGLKLTVDLGGERSTAAIDSLSVIAFDLAAMCMSLEGHAHQPAVLIHDSPREADLGLSIFHRLFEVVRSLEQISKQPVFQYIITTTTSPPRGLRTKPWMAMTLGGDEDERLLRQDLR